jgi:hypothetical protein
VPDRNRTSPQPRMWLVASEGPPTPRFFGLLRARGGGRRVPDALRGERQQSWTYAVGAHDEISETFDLDGPDHDLFVHGPDRHAEPGQA